MLKRNFGHGVAAVDCAIVGCASKEMGRGGRSGGRGHAVSDCDHVVHWKKCGGGNPARTSRSESARLCCAIVRGTLNGEGEETSMSSATVLIWYIVGR